MDEEIRDTPTPMQKPNIDTKMTPSEVGKRHCGKGRDRSPEHTRAMEKAGRRQCTIRATRSYPIPIPPKGGSKIQRAQVHAQGDRTPRNKIRRGTTATLTQVDDKEER